MAKREGLIYNFFEKWKERRLNKMAKRLLKSNPGLEKDLKALDKTISNIGKEISNSDIYFNHTNAGATNVANFYLDNLSTDGHMMISMEYLTD